jgi:hypothetical protein
VRRSDRDFAGWSWCFFAFALLWAAATCRAQDSLSDGIYGRLRGDTILSVGAGSGAAIGELEKPLATLDLRARYLDSAGIVLAPQWRPERGAEFGIGLELRPFFLARLFLDSSFDRRFFDLLVDSIGIELGSFFGPLDRHFGSALFTGTGIDIPLGADGSRGFYLRIAARYLYASARDVGAPDGGRSEWLLLLTFYFRTAVTLGLAAREPPRYLY